MKKLIYTFVMIMTLVLAGNSFAKAKYSVNGVANINTASKAQLVMIPGIGESKAEAILQQRSQKPFSSKGDLLAIKGIGEKVLAKISTYVSVKGDSTINQVKVAVETKNRKKAIN